MSVGDNLIGAVSQHKDPADSNSQDFSTAYYVKGDGYVDQAELSAEANLINYHNQNWYMDSGASHHFRKERGKFYVIEQRHLDKSVKTADDKSHRVDAIGSSSAATHSGTINLSNVLCVPALKQNLMSVGASADTGHIILFTDKRSTSNHKGDMSRLLCWPPASGALPKIIFASLKQATATYSLRLSRTY